jgi:hypothetical protein
MPLTNSGNNIWGRRMTTAVNSLDIQFDSIYRMTRPSALLISEETRLVKQMEKDAIVHFLNTGVISNFDQKVVGAKTGDLGSEAFMQLTGRNVQDTGVIFTLYDSGRIVANTKRANHIISELQELARREGIELEYTGAITEFFDGEKVMYWPWKHPLEVDDSELVTQTVMREVSESNGNDEEEYNPWEDFNPLVIRGDLPF